MKNIVVLRYIVLIIFIFLSDAWRIVQKPFSFKPITLIKRKQYLASRHLSVLQSTNLQTLDEQEKLVPVVAEGNEIQNSKKKRLLPKIFSNSLSIALGATAGFFTNAGQLPLRIATSAVGGAIGYAANRFVDKFRTSFSEIYSEAEVLANKELNPRDEEYYRSKQYEWDQYVKKIQPKDVNDLIPAPVIAALREFKLHREKPLTSYTYEELQAIGQKHNQTESQFKNGFLRFILANYIYQFTDRENLNLLHLDAIKEFIDHLRLTNETRIVSDAIMWAACDLGEKLDVDEFGWLADNFSLRNFLQACKLYYLTDKFVQIDNYHGKKCHTVLCIFPYDEYRYVLTNACRNTFEEKLSKMFLFPFNYTNADYEHLKDVCVTNSRQVSMFHMNTTFKYLRIHLHDFIHRRINMDCQGKDFQTRFRSFADKSSVVQNSVNFWEKLDDLTRITLFEKKELIQYMNIFGFLKNQNETGFYHLIEEKTLPYYAKFVSDIFGQLHFSYDRMTTFLQNWQTNQQVKMQHQQKLQEQQEKKLQLKLKKLKTKLSKNDTSSSSSSSLSATISSIEQQLLQNASSCALSSLYQLSPNLLIQKKQDYFISGEKAREIIIDQVRQFNSFSRTYLQTMYEKTLQEASKKGRRPEFRLFYYELARYAVEFSEIVRLTKDFFSPSERMTYLSPISLESDLDFIKEQYFFQIYGIYRLTRSMRASEQELFLEQKVFSDENGFSSSIPQLLSPPIEEFQAMENTNEGDESDLESKSRKKALPTTIQTTQQQKIFDFIFHLSPNKEKSFAKKFSMPLLNFWLNDQLTIHHQIFIDSQTTKNNDLDQKDNNNELKKSHFILQLMNNTLHDFFQAAHFNETERFYFQCNFYLNYGQKLMQQTIENYYLQKRNEEGKLDLPEYYAGMNPQKLLPIHAIQEKINNKSFTFYEVDRCILPSKQDMMKLKSLSEFFSIPKEIIEGFHGILFGPSFKKYLEHLVEPTYGLLTSESIEKIEEMRNSLDFNSEFTYQFFHDMNVKFCENSCQRIYELLCALIHPTYVEPDEHALSRGMFVGMPEKGIADGFPPKSRYDIKQFMRKAKEKVMKHVNLIVGTNQAITNQELSRTAANPFPPIRADFQQFHDNRFALFLEINYLVELISNNYQLQPWNQTIARSNNVLSPIKFSTFLNTTVRNDLYPFIMIQKLFIDENQYPNTHPDLPPLNNTSNEFYKLKTQFQEMFPTFITLFEFPQGEAAREQKHIELTATIYEDFVLHLLKNKEEVTTEDIEQFTILADEMMIPTEMRANLQDALLRQSINSHILRLLRDPINRIDNNVTNWTPAGVKKLRKQIESLGYSIGDILAYQPPEAAYAMYNTEAMGLIDNDDLDGLQELNLIYNMTNPIIQQRVLKDLAYTRINELQNLILYFGHANDPEKSLHYTTLITRYYRFITDDVKTIKANGKFFSFADYERVLLFLSMKIDDIKNDLLRAYREYEAQYKLTMNPPHPLLLSNALSLAENYASISQSTAEDSKLSISSILAQGPLLATSANDQSHQQHVPQPTVPPATPPVTATAAGAVDGPAVKGKRGRKRKNSVDTLSSPQVPPAQESTAGYSASSSHSTSPSSSLSSSAPLIDLNEAQPKKSPEELAYIVKQIEEKYLEQKATLTAELRKRQEEYDLLLHMKQRLFFDIFYPQPKFGIPGLLGTNKPIMKRDSMM